MRYRTHIITQKFWLDEAERRKVVYSTRGYQYDKMWAELENMGAEKPENAICIKKILWDPEDGGCLIDWIIGVDSPVSAVPD